MNMAISIVLAALTCILIGALVITASLYSDHYCKIAVHLKFSEFLRYYQLNPSRYKLTSFSINYTGNNDLDKGRIVLDFIGYFQYRIWRKRKIHKCKVGVTTMKTIQFLNLVQSDIDSAREHANRTIDTSVKHSAILIAECYNKNS